MRNGWKRKSSTLSLPKKGTSFFNSKPTGKGKYLSRLSGNSEILIPIFPAMNLKKSITAESIMPITGMGKIARGGVGVKPGAGSTSLWARLNPSKDMRTLKISI